MSDASFVLQQVYEIDSDSAESTFITVPSDEELELSRVILGPNIELIELYLRSVRKSVDQKINYLEDYPKGCCLHISNEVLSIIQELGGLEGEAIQNFVKAGGKLRRVWGIYNDKYFQNMIQAGSYLFDVAHDAARKEDNPVVIREIESASFENVDTMKKFIKTAEKYWKVDIYPNVYFPEIAPVFPLICIHENGFIDIDQSVIELNVKSGFSEAQKFLETHPYSNKRLDGGNLKNIKEASGYLVDTDSETLKKWIRYFVDNAAVEVNSSDFINSAEEVCISFHEAREERKVIQEVLNDPSSGK